MALQISDLMDRAPRSKTAVSVMLVQDLETGRVRVTSCAIVGSAVVALRNEAHHQNFALVWTAIW